MKKKVTVFCFQDVCVKFHLRFSSFIFACCCSDEPEVADQPPPPVQPEQEHHEEVSFCFFPFFCWSGVSLQDEDEELAGMDLGGAGLSASVKEEMAKSQAERAARVAEKQRARFQQKKEAKAAEDAKEAQETHEGGHNVAIHASAGAAVEMTEKPLKRSSVKGHGHGHGHKKPDFEFFITPQGKYLKMQPLAPLEKVVEQQPQQALVACCVMSSRLR